jgi:beta-lactamase regulating signal transducer with metallopeptidase domain
MRHQLTALTIACALSLGMLSLAAAAQTNSNGNSSQTTTQQTTRTTETTSQPTTVQVTRTAEQTGINPLWIAIGVVVLLGIIAIVALSARGRSSDHTAVVSERETVVRRE